MLPTKPFQSLKGLLPNFNHPLPLNEKSTKKLLDTLTTSFRKNLDREHGWLDETADGASMSKKHREAKALLTGVAGSAATTTTTSSSTSPASSIANSAATVNTSSVTQSAAAAAAQPRPKFNNKISTDIKQTITYRPTDRHMRSILSNPLFSYGLAFDAPVRSDGAKRDPMEIFDWAVARGTMTPKRALGCLLAKQREILESSSTSVKAAMVSSGAGLKVLAWLQSAGLERNFAFISHDRLTTVLVQFLAADPGLEEIVWHWIERLKRGEGPEYVHWKSPAGSATGHSEGAMASLGASHQVAAASSLLHKLLAAKITDATTLDDAYRVMCRGADLFDKQTPAFEGNIFWPWCYLSWESTFKMFKDLDMDTATPRLYETFVSVMDHDNRPSILLERAHLDLRHPTNPTPLPAVQLLADNHLLRDVEASTPMAEPPRGLRPTYRNRIVSLGLDTARHLSSIGESEEAQRIFDRLRDQFGAQFQTLHLQT
ncbi:hypothetical protein F503_03460 [Ophiostoma piceae UAMH 11346]|uniref:Uncharacterized protein n=1 Tax=Ophiostoma piceae (strain UAMH 11346) TaxID=1262450 RepID=S3CKL9_OPHP1|nr:hypothetical protein F503_03460 [Ophiostoma piceae UAMH 11346]